MKKTNVISTISAVVAVAALAVSVTGCMAVNKDKDDLNKNNTVTDLPAVSTPETAETASPESADTAAQTYLTGNLDVDVSDGSFTVSDDSVFVLGSEAESRDTIAVKLPAGATDIEYNEASGYVNFVKDGIQYRVANVPVEEMGDNSLIQSSVLDETGGNYGSLAKYGVTETTGVIAYTIHDEEPSDEASDAAIDTCAELVQSATKTSDTMIVSVMNHVVNPDYAKDIVLTGDVLSFSNGTDTVTVAPYTDSVEDAEFDNEVVLNDNMTVLEGDYKDADTGATPFIFDCEDGTVKMVATNSDVLKAAFDSFETGSISFEVNQ